MVDYEYFCNFCKEEDFCFCEELTEELEDDKVHFNNKSYDLGEENFERWRKRTHLLEV